VETFTTGPGKVREVKEKIKKVPLDYDKKEFDRGGLKIEEQVDYEKMSKTDRFLWEELQRKDRQEIVFVLNDDFDTIGGKTRFQR